KSHFFAEKLIARCIRNQGTRWACIREVQKSLDKSAKQLIEDKLDYLAVRDGFRVTNSFIETPGEGVIIFEGMQNHTADSIKSLEGFDFAWVEEAQTLSQRSLDLLRPTIRKEDSELWFSWNPENADDPVDVLLRGDNPPPNSTVIQVNYIDNPLFPEVLKEEMEYDKSRDVDKYTHIWLGAYQKNSEARIFHNWKVEEFDIPKDAVIRQGADWGFSIDPTVLVQCFIEGRTLYVPYEAYKVNCEIVDTPVLFLTVPNSEKWPITADSARPETISHLQKNGYPKVMPAVKGARSIEEGLEFLKSYDIVVHPRCQHVIDELSMYSYKTDPMTGKVLPVIDDKNNHTIDSLRYACEGARRLGKSKPKSKPRRQASWMS
ncbi:PBSX family phage terminase large subunit, partial [Solemya elarraichensis gill symbiont]